ncbi:MAG: energy-coupling factor ABC transporter permease [Candidatus Kariarchaeaceae archaeon]
MRIIEGIVHPAVVIIGWIIAFIAIFLLAKYRSELSNQELSHLAALGGFVFLVQSFVIIPIPVIPFVIFTLSGITLVITIVGVTRGILVGSAAMILNHFLIPGSLSMLGTNLTNMIITGLIIGWLPSQFYRSPNTGLKLKYLASFLGAFLYTIIEGIIVLSELVFLYNSESDIQIIGFGFIIYVLILALAEGIFTAMAVSYYYRSFQLKEGPLLDLDMEPELTEIQKIDFKRFYAIQQMELDTVPDRRRRTDFE